MRPFLGSLVVCAALVPCGSRAAGPTPSAFANPPAALAAPAGASALELPRAPLLLEMQGPSGATDPEPSSTPQLGPERARILLQSLTVPGWGQATLGHSTSAKAFALTDAGIWVGYAAFRIQERLRRDSYHVTALLFAGIDLSSHDEEFRRIVGVYPSSDEYNRYVVRRDAANLYYDDPEAYARYIAENELKGDDTWAWVSPESYAQYQDEREATRKAALRANAMLGLAIANRLLSAVHAARFAGAPQKPRSWRVEVGPRERDPAAMALRVKVRF